ncbi:MAG: TIGR03960 family B12-binding radical SAM protein [Oscillospiraceae bacterium]|nr:TIGR03960 family B12-binding radical SAM protein [Oscillospiraceae bacterium]
MQKNSNKPVLVPTAYSARTALWTLALVVLFAALLWDYCAWSSLSKSSAKLKEPVQETVEMPLYTVRLPLGWEAYAKDGDALAVFRRKGEDVPLVFCYAERGEEFPIVIGGGHCAYNPEPIADFFDIFSIGEGEEALPELCRLYIDMKQSGGYTKERFLHAAAKLEGFYVPSLYAVEYNADGTIGSITPKVDDIPAKVRKRIVKDLDKAYFPTKTYAPYIETVQDKMVLEVYRGCIRGCRFCQAGMVCRPVREKSVDKLFDDAKCMYEHSGYDEMTLSSLSISDYSQIDELTDKFAAWTTENHISLSLPSLRLDSFTRELMDKVSTVRTGSLTFAPEAGTQRLRDAINKNVCENDLLRAVNVAYDVGKTSVKLYFMNGLPTETDEDIEGIALLAKRVIEAFYANPNHNKQRRPSVTVSVSCFVPKPFTPFQ